MNGAKSVAEKNEVGGGDREKDNGFTVTGANSVRSICYVKSTPTQLSQELNSNIVDYPKDFAPRNTCETK